MGFYSKGKICMNSMSSYKSTRLSGNMEVPGDKSISHRALIIGSLVTGKLKLIIC